MNNVTQILLRIEHGDPAASEKLLPLVYQELRRLVPHKKPNLPEKLCVVCGRPFQWRKKWEKVWDEVKYCSDKCRKYRDDKPVNKSEKS